ncbi:hypothetical protein M011DRAFT_406319 [Sporormia fimetaria CBS 119925]|uniref:Uncharacterized protein n=1 Tax=Sporormia fimetaria CBS 119925 TaxID=1340428 RepID=A0A6A6V715_9PLEO|nr:hypothetical protein M011DRAFT_406319 [Sporormia fimetaria CBS 119925]
MGEALDLHKLRGLTLAEAAKYLRDVRTATKDIAITDTLLGAIDRGSITPTIFAIWIFVSRDPDALHRALKQTISIEVRRGGICALKKGLKTPQWETLWDTLGGAPGLADIMTDFSVYEVQHVCSVIASSGKGEERRNSITRLLKILLPRSFPDAVSHTTDERPLEHYYKRIITGCDSGVVAKSLKGEIEGLERATIYKNYWRWHTDTLKNLIFDLVLRGTKTEDLPSWKKADRWGTTPKGFLGSTCHLDFYMDILRIVVQNDLSTNVDLLFLRRFETSLIRRYKKHKLTTKQLLEAVDLYLRVLEKNPVVSREAVKLSRGGLLELLARKWSRTPDKVEVHLRRLLAYTVQEEHYPGFNELQNIMGQVAPWRRHAFLRYCFLTVADIDIDSIEQLQHARGTKIPYKMYSEMEPSHALALFERVRSAKGNYDLVGNGGSLCSQKQTHSSDQPDVELIHVFLLGRAGRTEEASKAAREAMQERMTKSATSSDQQQRAWYASSSLHYATASGDLHLLKDAYTWAQRFIRDPLTCSSIYYNYTEEMKSMLGLSDRSWMNAGLSEIRADIIVANSILSLLTDTAFMAIKEPSFKAYVWVETWVLIPHVVRLRMKGSRLLEKRLDVNSQSVYDAVWEDTLRLLIDVEKIALKAGHKRMAIAPLGGILEVGRSGWRNWSDKWDIADEATSTYHFWDNLAQARDQLWREYRPTVYPAVAALPEPYPRGLPIQHLLGPFTILEPNLEQCMPYLAERAHGCVFIDPTAAAATIPRDKERSAAIGYFIDDYSFALRMLCPDKADEGNKKELLSRACEHVLRISQSTMTLDEATRYWGSSHVEPKRSVPAWPCEPKKMPATPYWPIVPTVEDPSEVVEWSPVPPCLEGKIPSRKISEETYLDLSKSMGKSSSRTISDSFLSWSLKLEIPGREAQNNCIWFCERGEVARKVPTVREGRILAAVLTLDAPNSSTDRILKTPFHSADEIRFPATYLDKAFLADAKGYLVLGVLDGHMRHVPPQLLEQVTRNTWNRVAQMDPKNANFVSCEQAAFQLINTFMDCDRPRLGLDLPIQAIIQRPDASSWHRTILARRVFRRLSASDTRQCFTAFSDAILSKLAEKAGEENKKEQKPFVKITTTKFLAQLLQDTDFVPNSFAMDVLSTLAQRTTHMDVKRAVLDSLLNLLRDWPPGTTDQIFKTLETMVPLIGTLSERRPWSESEWSATLLHKAKPPELDTSVENAPMWASLVNFVDNMEKGHEKYVEMYRDRILHSVLKGMQKDMKHWLSLFLASVSAPPDLVEQLPLVPRSLSIWDNLLSKHVKYMSRETLEEWTQYQIFCIDPPAAVTELNRRLRGDPALMSRPAVQTWLSMYDVGFGVLNRLFDFQAMLMQDYTILPGDINLQTVHDQYLRLLKASLSKDSPGYTKVLGFLRRIEPMKYEDRDSKILAITSPIVDAFISHVESLRTEEWQLAENRDPPVLPDTLPLRLWLQKYPTDKGDKSECEQYAEQLKALVQEMEGTAYHRKLIHVRKSLSAVKGADRVVVALHLCGSEKSSLTTVGDELLVELAAELLHHASGLNHPEDVLRKRDDVIGSWRRNLNEEIRRLGYAIKLRDKRPEDVGASECTLPLGSTNQRSRFG